MSKHTPGPWRLEGSWSIDSEQLGGWVSTSHPSPLFSLEPITGGPTEIIANAHLIAAAPDLVEALDALGEAISEADETDDPAIFAAMARARAALAKAEGSPTSTKDTTNA